MGWGRKKLKFTVFPILLITITTLFTSLICNSEAKLVSGDKSLEDSVTETKVGVVDKKVSFTSDKSVPKIFGSIPLPWPFNITNTAQLPNQNPGGFLTGSGNNNADPGNFGGSFGTLGTSVVLVSSSNISYCFN